MAPTIEELSKKIARDFANIDKKAKNLLQILVCGSYKNKEDLGFIEKFRDRQKGGGIVGTFLMKDFKVIDEKTNNEIELPPHEKMHLIWDIMKGGDNIPLFVLFAGKSSNESTGLNAEIQTIAYDKKKIDCAHLYKVPSIELVSHEECFSKVTPVKDGEEFITEAEKVVDAHIKQAKMFYQAKSQTK